MSQILSASKDDARQSSSSSQTSKAAQLATSMSPPPSPRDSTHTLKKRKVGGNLNQMSQVIPSAIGNVGGHSSSSSQTSQVAPVANSLFPPQTRSNSAEGQVKLSRGYSKGVPRWNAGAQIEVTFDDNFQAVGQSAAQLKSQLGIMAWYVMGIGFH